MKVLTSGKKIAAEVPMSFFHFERFEKQCGDFLFIDARINFAGLKDLKLKNDKIVYFEIEEPNRFNSSDRAFRREEYENDFYKILSVCPYTTEWLNKNQNKERRQFVFFPFDKETIPATAEKKYDVIYFGGIHSRELFRTIKTISKFNYRFIAPSEEKTYKIIQNTRLLRKIKKTLRINRDKDRYITDKNVSHSEKLSLIAQTKITIVHNHLSQNALNVRHIQNTKDFRNNYAFRLIPNKNIIRSVFDFMFCKEYIVPQQKTRLFEAALCKSLILCRKDPFNVVERFFIPNQEFIYYEEGKLEEKITQILENFDSYRNIIENAYNRAIKEYTTEAFFEKYLKPIK